MRTSQIHQSKERIIQGFKALMIRQAYDTITLSRIASKAGVSRMTLYRHFASKEAVLDAYLQSLHEAAKEQLSAMSTVGLRELLLLRHRLLATEPVLQRLMQQPSLHAVVQQFASENIETFFPASSRWQHNPTLPLFLLGGLERITKEWFTNGCTPSPEQFTDQVMELLQPMIDQLEPGNKKTR